MGDRGEGAGGDQQALCCSFPQQDAAQFVHIAPLHGLCQLLDLHQEALTNNLIVQHGFQVTATAAVASPEVGAFELYLLIAHALKELPDKQDEGG